MTFKIAGKPPRLDTDSKLTPVDFAAIGRELGIKPIRARKVGYVAAQRADKPEIVETRWNGRETSNTARVGDWIVTNLSPQRRALRDEDGLLNVYVIAAARFARLYEPTGESCEYGAIYRARGVVSALPLPGGFDIMAPWGERQTGAAGYLLLNGDEVTGSSWEAFAETYEIRSRTPVSGKNPAERQKPGRAFVIMPFDSAFDHLHRRAIRPALEAFGLVPERYDDAPRAGAVLEEMHRSIDQARVVIAVVTGKNPHVFFELGITFARNKPCVLMAGSTDDVPDFLQHLPHVVYGDDPDIAFKGLTLKLAALRLAGEVVGSPGVAHG